MFLNKRFLVFILLILQACSEAPIAPKLTIREQLVVDTMKAKGLVAEFEKLAQFEKSSSVEKYLTSVARQIVREEDGLKEENVVVRIHQDSRKEWKKTFSFPGLMISIPKSFLSQVNFENELAALISLQLALIENRELARTLEKNSNPVILGEQSVFRFSSSAWESTIELGTKMMYAAGYDPRGMVSLLQKHSGYFQDSFVIDAKKDFDFFIKQAQKAKNNFMPSLQPIVRSNDFLRMKKDLKGSS